MILQAGDPNLKKVELEENDFESSAFTNDLNLLIDALREHGGMGLAAPQLGIMRRILLIESKPNKRYPYAPHIELMTIINPKIVEVADEEEMGWEGCLSVSGKRVEVSRPVGVKFKCQNQYGEPCEYSLDGFAARIFFHEFDHLEGLTILDRAKSDSDIVSEQEYFTTFFLAKINTKNRWRIVGGLLERG